MENELLNKFKVVHFDGCRYYKVDLKQKQFNLENTTPFCISIQGVSIFDSSWKNLIPRIVEELDSKYPKTEEELLSIAANWSKQTIFSRIRKANYSPYKDIYINTNHTAVHALWVIQLILESYNINFDECEMIIRRPPSVEPLEIQEYYKEKMITGFELYLANHLKKQNEAIKNVVKNIKYANEHFLSKISKGYNNFFLIEDPSYYSNYSKKTLDYMKERGYNEQILSSFSKQLSYLGEYIKIVNKENKVLFSNYSFTNKKVEDLDNFIAEFDADDS